MSFRRGYPSAAHSSPPRFPAFLGYEHLITFDTEVTLYWKKQFSGASVLFFANRYLTLMWAIATAASPFYTSPKVSDKVSALFVPKHHD